MQAPPVIHTLPGSAQTLVEAFKKDVVAVENSIPAASPHQLALDLPTGRSRDGEVWGVAEPAGGPC